MSSKTPMFSDDARRLLSSASCDDVEYKRFTGILDHLLVRRKEVPSLVHDLEKDRNGDRWLAISLSRYLTQLLS